MDFISHYSSPLGPITLSSNGEALTGLWFDGQKYFGSTLPKHREEQDCPVFRDAFRWLDLYFEGRDPDFTPPLAPKGSVYRQKVWKSLLEIPYGQTVTYARLAGLIPTSPRAVAGAVAHNPISLNIPCHRVIGTGGALTGYAGGLEKKRYLLRLEGAL